MGGSQSPEGKAQGEHARCTQKGPSWPKGILIQDLFAVRQHCSPPHQIYTHVFILTSATLQVLEQEPEKEFFFFQGHDVNTNKSQPRAVISSLIHRYCVCCFIYFTYEAGAGLSTQCLIHTTALSPFKKNGQKKTNIYGSVLKLPLLLQLWDLGSLC